MINNYRPPRLRTRLLIAPEVVPGVRRLQALILGPQYHLSRYGKESVIGVAFDAAGGELSYQYVENGITKTKPASWEVDLDTVKLYAEKLEAQYASYSAGDAKIYLDALNTPNILRLAGANNLAGTGLETALRNRPVKAGDVVVIDDGAGNVYKRKVAALLGRPTDSSYGTDGTSEDNNFANATGNPVTAAIAVPVVISEPEDFTITVDDHTDFAALDRGPILPNEQKYGEIFTLTVRTGGAPGVATFDITSQSGKYAKTNVASADASGDYSITNSAAVGELAGLDFTITKDGASNLVAGQVFQVKVYGGYSRLSTTQIAGSDAGDGYTGARNTTYIIEVVTGGALGVATVRISDTAGVDTPATLTPAANVNFNVGTYGLRAKFNFTSPPTQAGLRAGDKYYVNAVAAGLSTTEFNRVILDGPAVNGTTFTNVATALKADFRQLYTGAIERDAAVGGEAWEPTATTLDLNGSLSLYMAERSNGYQWVAFVDDVGKIFPSWRALIPATASQGPEVVGSEADISDLYGPIDIDNDLAYAAARAVAGAQGNQIVVLATAGVDAADFSDALRKVEATDTVYALCPVSNSLAVFDAVKAHVLDMSSDTKQQYRRMYASVDSPGTYPVLKTRADDSAFVATIDNYGGEYLLLTAQDDDVDFESLDIEDGDRLLLPVADEEYEVAQVLSPTELVLKSGPDAAITVAVPFQIWRADTPESQSDYVRARARSLAHYRVSVVWGENGTREIDGVPTIIPARYVAAEYAGIRSALPAQQGLSRQAITSWSAASDMYTRYSQADLDEIAADGVAIITQDVEDGLVYIRHQLTTKATQNPIEYEDNLTVVLDTLGFQVNDDLYDYVGKRNANAYTVAEVYTRVNTILTEASRQTVNDPVGPLIAGYDNLIVEINPILRDRINISVRIFPSLPLNEIFATLTMALPTSTA